MSNFSLKIGDEVRVIAPSMSKQPKETRYAKAQRVLENEGLIVTYGKYVDSLVYQGTATPLQRIEDLHAAFADKHVKAIMTLNGGWSVNELLPYIDWKLIKENPKPIVGYSDNTILLNAIYAMTNMVTYLGPHFGTLGYQQGQSFTLRSFLNIVRNSSVQLQPSENWTDLYSSRRKPTDWKVLSAGEAEGVILGGNAGSFYLLQGTAWMPQFSQNTILVFEDDALAGDLTILEFDRRLESILQLPNARNAIKGILIGRFQKDSDLKLNDLKEVIKRKGLEQIAVIADMDFGHTLPMFTLPIGGRIKLMASNKNISLQVVQ